MALLIASDLRPLFGPIRDQGQRPTCVAFSVSDAHGAARGDPKALSAEHLHYSSVKWTLGGQANQGVPLTASLSALKQDGQCFEEGWPYLKTLPADLDQWRPPSSAIPLFRRDATDISLDYTEIVMHLEAGRPILVVLLLGNRFFSPKDGIVLTDATESDVAYHALIIVGHGTLDGEPAVLVRNSWGPTWGLGGYSWLTKPYLTKRAHQAAVLSLKELP